MSDTTETNYLPLVRDIARGLMLLDEQDELIILDSLTLVEFVTKLEKATGLTIPTRAMQPSRFRTLETVAATLAEQSSSTR